MGGLAQMLFAISPATMDANNFQEQQHKADSVYGLLAARPICRPGKICSNDKMTYMAGSRTAGMFTSGRFEQDFEKAVLNWRKTAVY